MNTQTASSSARTPDALARAVLERFEGRGETSLGPELFAAGYALNFPGFPRMDAAGHAGVVGAFRAAFPDLAIRVLSQVVEGDLVCSHVEVTGTHRGPFNGIPATGRSVRVTGNNLMRVTGGRVAEAWGFLDMLGMMQQLGVAPEGPPRPSLPAQRAGERATPAEAKALVRRFVEGFNAKDPASLSTAYGESYDLDFPGGPSGHGVAGIREASSAFLAAFPDLHFSIEALLSDGDRVAWRWVMTGTHRGALGPFAASGARVTLPGVSLFTVRDGLIVEDRVRADMVGLLQQIGAIPRP